MRLVRPAKAQKQCNAACTSKTLRIPDLIQVCNNVTRVPIKPRSCDHGHYENNAFPLSATLPCLLLLLELSIGTVILIMAQFINQKNLD